MPHFTLFAHLVGGGYLTWIGLTMIRACFGPAGPEHDPEQQRPDSRPLTAWRTGLLTNLTNPKAWAFYIALFTLVLTPGLLAWHKVLLNSSIFIISFSWYALVALLMTHPPFRPLVRRIHLVIQFFLGLALVGLGGRMLLMV